MDSDFTIHQGITVVIPLYNKKEFLGKTINSVLSQDFPLYEVIIVDDGSTDGSLEEAQKNQSDKVRVVSQENSGPGHARNKGVEEGKYEWVAFIDADDVWEPGHLSELNRLREIDFDAGLVATKSRKIKSYDDIGRGSQGTEGLARDINYLEESKFKVGVIHTSAAMVNKNKFQKLGGFPSFMIGEDVELWIRIDLHFRILGSDKVTSYHLLGTGGLMDGSDVYCSSKDGISVSSLGELSPLMGSLEAIYFQLLSTDTSKKNLREYINSRLVKNIKVLIVKRRISLARQISRLFIPPESLENTMYRISLSVFPNWMIAGFIRSRNIWRTLIN